MFAGATVGAWAREKRSNKNKTSLCSHENPPVNQGQVLSFYLSFGLGRKEWSEVTGAALRLWHKPVQARKLHGKAARVS